MGFYVSECVINKKIINYCKEYSGGPFLVCFPLLLKFQAFAFIKSLLQPMYDHY